MKTLKGQLKEIQMDRYIQMLKDVFGDDSKELGKSVFGTVQL